MSGVSRILVITAHPDDVDFGCAGSVATWTDQGIDVVYCIVTDGDAGGSDRSVTRAEMAKLRRTEQTGAAAVVGVTDVRFLGYPDGRLEPSLELRRDLTRVIRQVQPDRVVAQSPQRNWQRIYASHPDHLACGEATLCAVYPDARNPFAFPELLQDEGLEPHTVGEVWIAAHAQPTEFVDVTAAFDRKITALQCHASQVGDRDNLADMLRTWMGGAAKMGGLPDGRLAEAFLAVDAR